MVQSAKKLTAFPLQPHYSLSSLVLFFLASLNSVEIRVKSLKNAQNLCCR